MISGLFGWLRSSHREESCRSAEILLLRHQLRVLRRQIDCRPKVTWADRALIALLLDLIPKGRRAGLRLFVSPETVLRWRRDILRRRWVRRSQHKHPGRPGTRRTSGLWSCEWRGRTLGGVTGGSAVNSLASAFSWRRRRCGRS